MCNYCSVTTVVLAAIALISSIAALLGVYFAHTIGDGLLFGSSNGSLSLLALAANLLIVRKLCAACGCTCAVPSKK